MKYVRLYEDETGESHFEDAEEELSLANFAPPAPPVFVSEPREATRLLFIRLPRGWVGGWHPAPKRQAFFCLSGKMEIKVSDGETRAFSAGDAILAEDTSGKGHEIKVIGEEEFQAAVVQFE